MNKFVIKTSYDEESFTVWLNGVQVGRADHDNNGWAGMDDVAAIVIAVANVLNIPIEHETENE